MTKSRAEGIVKLSVVLASIVLFILVVLGIVLSVRLKNLSNTSAALDKVIEQSSITQAELEAGIELRSSDAYVEQQAREHLGMIQTGEEVIIIK